MIYLGLSIFTSILMVFLFKWFEKYHVNLFQAIVFNYYACLITGFMLAPAGSLGNLSTIFQESWILGAILLGALFITCFPLTGLSVQHNGTAVTTIAGRTSMVLPVAAAVWLYGDSLSATKIIGIILAIVAVYLTTIKNNNPLVLLDIAEGEKFISTSSNAHISSKSNIEPHHLAIFPLLIFIMNGIIEITFNYTQKMLLPDARHVAFTMSLFLVAAIIGTTALCYQFLRKQTTLQLKNVVGGIILGVPNYLSAYFFLQALSKSGLQSSVVIPINNIAVVLGSCLGAWLLFGEKLSWINGLGILLASIAIALIAV